MVIGTRHHHLQIHCPFFVLFPPSIPQHSLILWLQKRFYFNTHREVYKFRQGVNQNRKSIVLMYSRVMGEWLTLFAPPPPPSVRVIYINATDVHKYIMPWLFNNKLWSCELPIIIVFYPVLPFCQATLIFIYLHSPTLTHQSSPPQLIISSRKTQQQQYSSY